MSATILLVEDNKANRYLATFLLESAGFRILHAHDGRAAVSLVQSERPDLVLMDIHMPEMDGYEAARCIHALPGMANLPLVAVTSYAMSADRERAFEAGFARYIEKPIDTANFVAQVKSCLPAENANRG